MNSKQRWSHFMNGVPGNYRDDLEDLSELQLRSLHKLFIRNKISGGTSAFVGAFALIPSGGISGVGIGIGTRRVAINQERISMIEAVMRRKGYKGHDKSWKDYALPVTLGMIGMGVGAGGIDALAGGGIESGVNAPTDLGPTPDITTPDPPPGLDDSITPPGLDDSTTPPFDQFAPTTPITPVDFVPPTPLPPVVEIPNVEWIMTDQGITPAIDGVLIDASYGQVDPSALYQMPIDPGMTDPSSYLAWSGDTGALPPGVDPYLDQIPLQLPGFDPTGNFLPVLPPDISGFGGLPIDQPDLSMVPNDLVIQPDLTGLDGYPYLQDGPVMGLDQYPPIDQQFQFDPYLPIIEDPSASSDAYGAASGIAAVAITHIGTHVGPSIITHAATHTTPVGHGIAAHGHHHQHQPHNLDELFRQGVEKAAEKAAKEAAKKAVKMIWEAVEKRMELPESTRRTTNRGIDIDSTDRSGTNQEQISQTPEFETELKALLASPEWKQLLEYLRHQDDHDDMDKMAADRHSTSKIEDNIHDNSNRSNNNNNRARLKLLHDLPLEHHQHCLISLLLTGDDLKLYNKEGKSKSGKDESARLKFFIEQADGNLIFVRAWIAQYVESLG